MTIPSSTQLSILSLSLPSFSFPRLELFFLSFFYAHTTGRRLGEALQTTPGTRQTRKKERREYSYLSPLFTRPLPCVCVP